MDELTELLSLLAHIDPARLYDEDTGIGDSYLSSLVERWKAAGYPGIAQGVAIPHDYADLCLIEVLPPLRLSRGRFYLPKSNGYTNDPAQAGLYTGDEARAMVDRSDRIRAVLPIGAAS